MSNLDLLNLKFKNTFNLSNMAISYIENLTLSKEIEVFLEVPEGASDGDVGWAIVEERKVCIRPTDDLETFEIRLVHELTHISNHDEGYPDLLCRYDDDLGSTFGNLLHHFIIYNKMKEYGFSMKMDTELVMKNLEEKLQWFSDLYSENNQDAKAYIVMVVMNDLIRLEDEEEIKYRSLANICIPECINKADDIITDILPNNTILLDIEWYKKCKEVIEEKLGIEKFNLSH